MPNKLLAAGVDIDKAQNQAAAVAQVNNHSQPKHKALADRESRPRHLPIQKRLNISPSRSSAVKAPVIRLSAF